jgi:ubiquinone biosynthesis protein
VPGIEDVIDADIAAMKALGPMLSDVIPGADMGTIVAEMSRSLREELDYAAEAGAARELGQHLGGGTLFVPAVIASHSGARVLTMARVRGARLGDHLDGADAAERSRVIGAMIDGVARQVFVHGLVHADPHPGNFLVAEDGRVAVLDFGCVLRIDAAERKAYAQALGALVARNASAAADALATLGFVGDRDALLQIAGRVVDALRPGVDASAIDWQEAFRGLTADLAAAGRAGGVTVPRSFVLLGRVLATVAGLIVQYKPRLEPFALLAPHVAAALR